jgi:hypothetical protein
MEASYGRQEVQLSGDELERARASADELSSSINAMALLMIEAVDGPSPSDREVQLNFATYQPGGGAQVLMVQTADGCYAYDGNTGVCRPCTGAELSSHA